MNTAIVLAQQGSRVLLVDADMRRAAVHKAVGMRPTAEGLSTLLAGQVEVAEVCQTHPQIANLKLIFAGPTPPHPAEMLGSAQLCHGTPEASLPLIEQGNGELDHGSNVPYAILPLCFGPQ